MSHGIKSTPHSPFRPTKPINASVKAEIKKQRKKRQLGSGCLSVAVLKSASGTHDQQKTRQSTVVSGAPGNTGDQVHLQLEIDPLAIRARCSCHNYNSKCSGLMTTTVAVAPAQWAEIQN